MAPRLNDLLPAITRLEQSVWSDFGLTGRELEPATSLTSEPDEALALRAIHDIEAFEELYRRYRLPIYRYHMAWTGNDQEAQSLTTQTFLAALEWISSYQFGGPFLRCFFGIASQLRRNDLRRRGGNIQPDVQADIPGYPASPEPVTPLQPEFNEVSQAIEALSDDVAEALILRIFAGFSPSEVGLIMLKSDTAVKVLVYEGLRCLKEQLSWRLAVEND